MIIIPKFEKTNPTLEIATVVGNLVVVDFKNSQQNYESTEFHSIDY